MALLVPLGVLTAGVYFIPWKDPAGRRRALWLLILPLPALAMIAFGPLGFVHKPYDERTTALLMRAQDVGVAASAIVGLGLLAALKDVRRSALILGVAVLVVTIAVAGANQIVISPSS
jgi:hypothetical protein